VNGAAPQIQAKALAADVFKKHTLLHGTTAAFLGVSRLFMTTVYASTLCISPRANLTTT
jgi:hypothetical protein